MNKWIWYLLGYDVVEITGASPQWAVNLLTQNRIPFWNICWKNPVTVTICIFRRDREAVLQIPERGMCDVKVIREIGFFRAFSGIFHRPILLAAVAVGLLAVLILPKFLWFYEVEGNRTVSDSCILRELKNLGIGPGYYGPNIKPAWIKNHMLQQLPQLEWITITQNGCIARVIIRERDQTPETVNRKTYANVVASKAGLITEQSILAGEAVHQTGDIVLKGDMLVSGLVDLENKFLITHAQAEIYARTWNKVRLAAPSEALFKTPDASQTAALWLEIGDRRIKIFGNSGISHASCDKMIDRKILSLPGNHPLPICLVAERYAAYDLTKRELDPRWLQSNLEYALLQRMKNRMQAGEILNSDLTMHSRGGYCQMEGVIECREMIAETVEAKWNEEDLKHD